MSLFDFLPPPKYSKFEKEENKGTKKQKRRKKKTKQKVGSTSTSILPYRENEHGEQDTSAIVRFGHRKDETIYHSVNDIIAPLFVNERELIKPNEDESKKISEQTQKEIEKRVNTKIAVTHKLKPKPEDKNEQQEYYRITSFDDEKAKKIVQIIDEDVDPLEPPKFKSKRLHRAPPSPPVPIVHSPKKKLSKEEIDQWNIPACISNWKNPRGYTIPLDKRLAADGKNLEEHLVNERFAEFAESMYVAENTAREEVEKHAKYQEALLLRKREEEERKMRELAEKARKEKFLKNNREEEEESANNGRNGKRSPIQRFDEETENRRQMRRRSDDDDDDRRRRGRRGRGRSFNEEEEEEEEDEEGIRERERMRRRIREDVERERREKNRMRRRKKVYEDQKEDEKRDRDISEKIALGIIPKNYGGGMRDKIDSRLYEEGGSGLGHGFGPSDEYNIYDKPFQNMNHNRSIYTFDESRVKKNFGGVEEYGKNKDKFVNFGREESGDDERRRKRPSKRRGLGRMEEDDDDDDSDRRRGGRPVMFEREGRGDYVHDKRNDAADFNQRREKEEDEQKRRRSSHNEESSKDPFAFLGLMGEAKRVTGTKRKREEGMGFMRTVGGASSLRNEDYVPSKRRKINFSEGKN